MSHPDSSLPDSWVERIWLAMRATYGATFDRQWECPAGSDPVEHVRGLKAFWGRELSRLQQNPAAIRYGLENLPTFPPNLIEFRALCNRRPEQNLPALPAPPADPKRVADALAKITWAASEGVSPAQQCAAGLRRRLADGQKLNQMQKHVLECCERHASPSADMAQFVEVPQHALPPAMRGVTA